MYFRATVWPLSSSFRLNNRFQERLEVAGHSDFELRNTGFAVATEQKTWHHPHGLGQHTTDYPQPMSVDMSTRLPTKYTASSQQRDAGCPELWHGMQPDTLLTQTALFVCTGRGQHSKQRSMSGALLTQQDASALLLHAGLFNTVCRCMPRNPGAPTEGIPPSTVHSSAQSRLVLASRPVALSMKPSQNTHTMPCCDKLLTLCRLAEMD